MTAFDNQRVAFEIGQDCARHGLPPAEPDNASYMEGYRLLSGRRSLPADRFVRKWLQVRTNAWRRNRHVEVDFTVQLLRDIDRPTCPVSQVPFTYGTNTDSDWSVDRIDNDGGYTAGNIVLISARVNREKGTRSILELLMLGYGIEDAQLAKRLPPTPPPGQLVAVEWQRLAWFASTQETYTDYPARIAFPDGEPFEHLTAPWCTQIQQALVEWTRRSASARDAQWSWLRSFAPHPQGLRLLKPLRESMAEYGRVTSPAERSAFACFADPVRWRSFAAWWIYLAQTGALKTLLMQLSDGLPDNMKVNVAAYRARKQARTGGYG
jgi:hypothetical protein